MSPGSPQAAPGGRRSRLTAPNGPTDRANQQDAQGARVISGTRRLDFADLLHADRIDAVIRQLIRSACWEHSGRIVGEVTVFMFDQRFSAQSKEAP